MRQDGRGGARWGEARRGARVRWRGFRKRKPRVRSTASTHGKISRNVLASISCPGTFARIAAWLTTCSSFSCRIDCRACARARGQRDGESRRFHIGDSRAPLNVTMNRPSARPSVCLSVGRAHNRREFSLFNSRSCLHGLLCGHSIIPYVDLHLRSYS